MRLLRIFETIIAWGFYSLFLITPVLFNPLRQIPSYELFEWNKMVFVYLTTSVILSAWIGKMILQRKINLTRTPFDIPILLFLGSAILSTLFSIDRHVSIFGYYSRFHGGLLSSITYTLLYYAFVSNRNLINLKRLIVFTLLNGFVVAIYGILEKFGIDAHMWVQDVRARVFSTFGQPNWLAAYLAILIPLSIYKLLTNFNNKAISSQLTADSLISKIKSTNLFGFLLIGLFYICLLFTRSRSGFLGFWAADILFWVVLLFFSGKQSYVIPAPCPSEASRKGGKAGIHVLGSRIKSGMTQIISSLLYTNRVFHSFLILHISFLILNFFITTPFSQYNKLATVQIFNNQPPPQETAPVGDSVINVGITDSADIRRVVWKGALDIAKTYPLFGTGPETFAYSYYKFRPVEHNLTSEWDFLYNRAHNEFLNIAATQGFLGLGLYLLLIISVTLWLIKQILAMKQSNNGTMLLALLSAYVSIHITNFFGFSVVVIGLFFYLIPAFAVALVKPAPPLKAQNLPLLGIPQYLQLGAVGLGLGFILFTLTRFWVSDSLYARANSLFKQDNYTESYPYIVTATQLRNDEPVYHDARADIAGNLAALAFFDSQATLGAELAQEAVSQSTIALRISPQNVNFWKTRTRILFVLGNVEPQFMEDALSSIQIAGELAPTDAKIKYNAAIILGRLGKNPEAITELEKTIELKPDYRDAYIALAIFYQDEKQIDKARETLELILKRINPDDEEVKKRLENLK